MDLDAEKGRCRESLILECYYVIVLYDLSTFLNELKMTVDLINLFFFNGLE